MKKYILVIISLLLLIFSSRLYCNELDYNNINYKQPKENFPLLALQIMHYPGVSTGCTTPNIGSEMNEGFLGAGYELGFNPAWIEGGTEIKNEDFTPLSGTPPANSCTEGLNVIATDAFGHTYWTRSSTIAYTTDVDVVCELYVDSATIDTGNSIVIMRWSGNTNATWNGTGYVEWHENGGGQDGWEMRGRGATTGTYTSVSLDTWYTVFLHLDGTAASSYITVDGGSEQYFTRSDINSRYLHLGAVEQIEDGEAITIEYGYCYVNIP